MINSSADFTGDTGNVEIRLAGCPPSAKNAEGWGNLVRNDVDKTVQRKQRPHQFGLRDRACRPRNHETLTGVSDPVRTILGWKRVPATRVAMAMSSRCP